MEKDHGNRIGLILIAAAIAFVIGFMIADDSAQVAGLRSELERRGHSNPPTRARPEVAPFRRARPQANTDSTASFEQSALSEKLEKFKITPEEWQATLALNKLRDQGQYILEHERPTTKKLMEHDFARIVAQAAEDQSADYDRVFAEIGIPAELGQKLKDHVAKIHKASLEAEVAIQQILKARIDYDKNVHSILGEENYTRYRQYEESKPALRESESIQKFAQNKNMALHAGDGETLARLIQEAGIYTEISWHGPFDGLPQVIMGKQNVLNDLQAKSQGLAQRSSYLVNRVPELGLASEWKDLITEYYSGKLQDYQRQIQSVENPPILGPESDDIVHPKNNAR